MPGPDLSFMPTNLPMSTGDAGRDSSAYSKAGLQALNGAPVTDIFSSPAFAQIQKLLGAGADGGLSPALLAMFNSGKQMNAMNTSQNIAAGQSDAVGRGLEGSSIESQRIESAQATGAMADSSLMGSLFGQQNSNNNNLAGMLFQGQQINDSQVNQRLQMLMALLSGAGDNMANIDMYNSGMSNEMGIADKNATAGMVGSIIGAGGAIGGGYLAGR